MSVPALALPRSAGRVAVLVMVANGAPTLCRFFGKCDGLLVIDQANNIREFYPNEDRMAESLCDLILKSGADRLICGFIPSRQSASCGPPGSMCGWAPARTPPTSSYNARASYPRRSSGGRCAVRLLRIWFTCPTRRRAGGLAPRKPR